MKSVSAPVIVLILCGAVFVRAAEIDAANILEKNGDDRYRAKKYSEAADFYLMAFQKSADNMELLAKLADTYDKNKDRDKAIQTYRTLFDRLQKEDAAATGKGEKLSLKLVRIMKNADKYLDDNVPFRKDVREAKQEIAKTLTTLAKKLILKKEYDRAAGLLIEAQGCDPANKDIEGTFAKLDQAFAKQMEVPGKKQKFPDGFLPETPETVRPNNDKSSPKATKHGDFGIKLSNSEWDGWFFNKGAYVSNCEIIFQPGKFEEFELLLRRFDWHTYLSFRFRKNEHGDKRSLQLELRYQEGRNMERQTIHTVDLPYDWKQDATSPIVYIRVHGDRGLVGFKGECYPIPVKLPITGKGGIWFTKNEGEFTIEACAIRIIQGE